MNNVSDKKNKTRKICEIQTIDKDTGEIISTQNRYATYYSETFFMGRTTVGIEWLFSFNNITEMQLLVLMLELEHPKNNYVISFTGLQVTESAKILNVSEIHIRKSLSELCRNDFLKRLCRGNYLANPLCFYKGSSLNLKERVKIYLNDTDKEEKYSNNAISI